MGVTVVRNALAASSAVTRARASVVIVAPIAETSATLLSAATFASIAGASITLVVPVSSLSYITMASGARLDTSGRFQYFSEVVTVADTSFRAVGKTLTDTFASTDYITSKSADIVKHDSVSVPDFIIRTLEFIRRFTDSFGFSDSPSFSTEKPLVDIFLISDAAAKGFNKPRADAFSLSDSAPVFSYQVAYFDSFALSETIRRTFSKALIDSTGTTDAAQFALGKHTADAFYLADSASRSTAKALTDSFTHTDAAAKDTAKALTDSFPLSDFAVRNTFKSFSDSFGSSETLTRALNKGVFDSLVLSDFSSRIIGRVINDGVAMNDSADLADNITYQAVKYITNLVFVSDATTVAANANKNDTVSLGSSGLLTSQNYCDMSYFAEDYVGSSRTFS